MTRIPTNLEAWLAAVPVRKVEALRDTEGRTVLLRPKFTSPALRWLQRLLPRPTFRVRLDAVGGSLWELCDGQRSVGAVFAELRARHGQEAEPVEERAGRFLHQLLQGGFLELRRNG